MPRTPSSRDQCPTTGRRSFLKTIPTALAAGLAGSRLDAQAPSPPIAAIDIAALKGAEQVVGVQFPDAEEAQALPNVRTNRGHIEALRNVPIGTDVEPAFSFRPTRPKLDERTTVRASRGIPRTPRGALPSSPDELAYLPAVELAAFIRTGKLTSVDLTRVYLDRLKRFGPKLECVITLTEDLALKQADEADREIKAGRYRGPLHGMPWGVKDLFATRGIRTTWGAKPYAQQVFDFDATAVERMHTAGAVLVAKLTTGELAIDDVWFGGQTRNPWNLARGSGGSSAGPASAAAAGLVGVAVGTETGGSIMDPASKCGVVGLRPTYGRISRHGAMTLRWTMDKVGAICRTVEDCAVVFDALRGPDGKDDTVVDAPHVLDEHAGLAGMRVGYIEREFRQTSEDASADEKKQWPAYQRLLDDALDLFRKAGVVLQPIALPDLPARSIYALLNAEAGAAFDDLVRAGGHNDLAGKHPGGRANQLRATRFIPAVDYIRAQRVRTLLAQQMNALMATCDVFLAPSDSASVAVTNLTGHPALTLNAGFVEGMPRGLMITGRLYDEATVLRVGMAYQRATTWHAMHPPLA